jgi:hypothetical protein
LQKPLLISRYSCKSLFLKIKKQKERITSWTRIKKNRKSAKCLKKTLRGTPIFAAVTF